MKKSNRKMYVAFVVICLIFLVILARSFQLQIIDHRDLSEKAASLSKLDIDIYPVRGDILDANGNVLATSTKYYDFWVTKTDLNYESLDDEAKLDFEKELDELVPLLGMTKEQMKEKIFGPEDSNLLIKDVTKEVADQVIANKPRWLAVASRYKRVYPFKSLAAHVIGVTNEEGVGLSGMELSFNDQLSGTRGKYVLDTDLHGNALALSDSKRYPATDGDLVQSTIDINIQQYTETWAQACFDDVKPKRVIMIVMETKTGEIKAFAAPPAFDLNKPTELPGIEGLSGEDYVNHLYSYWGNPGMEALFEPGSISKLLTVAAALEDNSITMDTQFYCEGYYHFPEDDTQLECWIYPKAHGYQDTTHALMNSCNPSFIQMGRMMDKGRLYHYHQAFGLDRRSRMPLGNEAYPVLFEPPTVVDEAARTYGYGYTVTPLQMLAAVNAVVNDGLYMEPHIHKKVTSPVTDQDQAPVTGEAEEQKKEEDLKPKALRQVISPRTSELVRGMMEATIQDSDEKYYDTKGIRMGGKTGTTYVTIDGVSKEENGERLAYFLAAPIQDPEYSIYLYIDQPSRKVSSTYNAKYSVNLMLDIMRYVGYGTDDVSEGQLVTVPDLTGHSPASVLEYLRDIGLTVTFKNYDMNDEDLVVKEQFPNAGDEVLRGANIIVNFGADMSGLHAKPPKEGLYETYIPMSVDDLAPPPSTDDEQENEESYEEENEEVE